MLNCQRSAACLIHDILVKHLSGCFLCAQDAGQPSAFRPPIRIRRREQSQEPGPRWGDPRSNRGSFFDWDPPTASTGQRSPASGSAGNAGSLPAARSRSDSVGRVLPSETVGPSPVRKLSSDFQRAALYAALSTYDAPRPLYSGTVRLQRRLTKQVLVY